MQNSDNIEEVTCWPISGGPLNSSFFGGHSSNASEGGKGFVLQCGADQQKTKICFTVFPNLGIVEYVGNVRKLKWQSSKSLLF